MVRFRKRCIIRALIVLAVLTLELGWGWMATPAQPSGASGRSSYSSRRIEVGGGVAQGQTGRIFFVGPEGDDEHPGSEAQPWRTLQHAAEVLEAGDTVYILAGRYNERVIPQNSGSEGQIIRYAAYPGHESQVVVDGAGIGFQGGGLFYIRGKSYITVSGLKVVNSDEAGILVSRSQHIVIRDSETRDTHSSGVGVWGSSYVVVEGNTIVNARNVPTAEGGHEECISIADTDHFEVRYNEVSYDGIEGYLGGAGIDVKESSYDGRVYRNYIHDVMHDTAIYVDAWEAGLDSTPTLHDMEIFQNRVDHCGSGVSIGSESGGTAENIKVYNNLLTRLGFCGIVVTSTSQNGPRRNIHIYNNTVYESLHHGGAGIYVATHNAQNVIIRNNVVAFGPMWQGEITVIHPDILLQVTADHNLIFGPQKCSQDHPDCQEVPNSLDADPQFVDLEVYDLRLSPGSPAVDAGIDLTGQGIVQDYLGSGRPQGAGFDLGAYESGDEVPTFVDVPADHPYYAEIEALYQAGYTAGCGTEPLRYCPDETMIRAESAVFVQRGVHGANYEPSIPAASSFADVPEGYWGAGWIEGLWEDGYTAGCGADPLTYCPLQEHTRAEGCVFYLRMLNGPDYQPPEASGEYADVPVGWWGAGWVEAAVEAGLIEPCETEPEVRFCPQDPLDRGLAAHMMVRAKELFLP